MAVPVGVAAAGSFHNEVISSKKFVVDTGEEVTAVMVAAREVVATCSMVV